MKNIKLIKNIFVTLMVIVSCLCFIGCGKKGREGKVYELKQLKMMGMTINVDEDEKYASMKEYLVFGKDYITCYNVQETTKNKCSDTSKNKFTVTDKETKNKLSATIKDNTLTIEGNIKSEDIELEATLIYKECNKTVDEVKKDIKKIKENSLDTEDIFDDLDEENDEDIDVSTNSDTSDGGLYDGKFIIEGKAIQIPCKISDLEAIGFEFDAERLSETLPANSVQGRGMHGFYKGESAGYQGIVVSGMNDTDSDIQAKDMTVTDLEYSETVKSKTPLNISYAGISMSSSIEDIKAFGEEPSHYSFEGTGDDAITYKTGNIYDGEDEKKVGFTFSNGKLNQISFYFKNYRLF